MDEAAAALPPAPWRRRCSGRRPSRPRPSRWPRCARRPACAAGTAARTASNTSSGKRMRLLERAAVVVVAPVGDRRQELMQQVAVRRVQLDGIEPERIGALRRPHEGRLDARQARRHRAPAGGGSPGACGSAEGATVCQAPCVRRQALAALPRHVARRLAARMARAGSRPGMRECARMAASTRAERRLVVVAIEAEVAGRDAPERLDRGRLDDQQPGARQRELPEVDQVPVGRIAVLGRVLAHRRDHDAVAQRQRAEREG